MDSPIDTHTTGGWGQKEKREWGHRERVWVSRSDGNSGIIMVTAAFSMNTLIIEGSILYREFLQKKLSLNKKAFVQTYFTVSNQNYFQLKLKHLWEV